MTVIFTRLKSNRSLALLLVAFVALAFFYSIIIPIFEGPDEDDHFRYAKFIADQRSFPVQVTEPGGGIAGHQGWQPPLYYSLVALIIAPIDTSDFPQQLARNYASTFTGDPACCGRNLYYHPDSQNFPWSGTTLAVHLARLLSITFGAVTVAATYALAKTLFPDQSMIVLAVASVVAFNPSFLFTSALVSNDAPLAAFSALTLLAWAIILSDQFKTTIKSAAVLGALIGVGLLVKTTALGLIPFSMLVILVAPWHQRNLRFAAIVVLAMMAVITLISSGWFTRNWILYGDPLAYRLMTTSAIFPRSGPLTPAELGQISLPWLWQTFWGGPTPGDFSPILLHALTVLTAFALIGFTLYVLRLTQRTTRTTLAFLSGWLVFILAAQIQFIQTTIGADQGRYLFPAIAAIALFFVVGLETFTLYVLRFTHHTSRLSFGICAFIIGSLFILALSVPVTYTLPAYARPTLLSENDLARAPHSLQVDFANQIYLRGYDLDARSFKPGETLRVTLYWQALTPMSESYRVFVQLVGQDNRMAGNADVIPARGAFPTLYWKPGDALRDQVQISIAPNAIPGIYSVQVGLYPVGKPSERLVTNQGEDRTLLDSIKIAPRQSLAFNPRTHLTANFADRIDLFGYDTTPDQNTLRLTLYWRARAPIDTDYKVFVHTLDVTGKIIAQIDQMPQAGNYPTSIWEQGEQVRDDYALAIPANISAKKIELGLYRGDTGERLPLTDGRDSVLIDLENAP